MRELLSSYYLCCAETLALQYEGDVGRVSNAGTFTSFILLLIVGLNLKGSFSELGIAYLM